MTDDAQPDDEEAEVLDVAEAGSELAGALAGGALGLIGGPAGALGGAVVGVFVSRGARHVVGRFRARERVRAGAALDLIAADAREREARGEAPRDDGFFDDRGALRSDGEELLEAVLMAAANAWDERKVALLARLYSAVAHDATVATPDVRFLVGVASDLTYRQFVALGVFANHEEHFLELAEAQSLREQGRATPNPVLLLELDNLGDRRLLAVEVDGRIGLVGEMYGSAGVLSSAKFGTIRPTAPSALLARLTGVDLLPDEERRKWVRSLRLTPPSGGTNSGTNLSESQST